MKMNKTHIIKFVKFVDSVLDKQRSYLEVVKVKGDMASFREYLEVMAHDSSLLTKIVALSAIAIVNMGSFKATVENNLAEYDDPQMKPYFEKLQKDCIAQYDVCYNILKRIMDPSRAPLESKEIDKEYEIEYELEDGTSYTKSSGNVFADLELPNPEEMLIEAEIKRRKEG